MLANQIRPFFEDKNKLQSFLCNLAHTDEDKRMHI